MGHDFLTVGSMGHASLIALGIARSQTERHVICLDGDGAVLMHMGGLAIIGQSSQSNLIHIILNNGAHDSVGGQPTCGFSIDISNVANACGYRLVRVAETLEALVAAFEEMRISDGPSLLEVRINKGSRKDLGRPRHTPVENRNNLMRQLGINI